MWNKKSKLDNVLVQYFRQNCQKKGMFISGNYNGQVVFGWSVCNKLDKFDKEKAFKIAEGRAILNNKFEKNIPYLTQVNDQNDFLKLIPSSMIPELKKFVIRISKYYKVNSFSEVIKYLIFSFQSV